MFLTVLMLLKDFEGFKSFFMLWHTKKTKLRHKL